MTDTNSPKNTLRDTMSLEEVGKEPSYFEKRMVELGVTAELNRIKLFRTSVMGENKGKEVLEDVPIFREVPQGIEILVYTLDRLTIRHEKEGSRYKKDYCMTRLEKPIVKPNGDTIKYLIPKKKGTYPFFPPSLIEKFEKREEIKVLVLTEGYFKAFKAAMHGADIIGLSSITHMKDQSTGAMHPEIIRLIKVCRVERVVWLTDADCCDITSKEITDGMDLYKRPAGFFRSATMFKDLLNDFDDVEKWFFHVNRKELDEPKGIDDLLIANPDKIDAIIKDLNETGENKFFTKFNITFGTTRIHSYFKLGSVNTFYLHHVERRKDLEGKEFVYNGTRYKYDNEKADCIVVAPGEAKLYFRVGDNYYKFIDVPNKYGQKERRFVTRKKPTINDDHGKSIFRHIPKYEEFCNVPDHANFQQVINNCFNVYNPFEHEPEPKDCTIEDFPKLMEFLYHVFGHGEVNYKHPVTGQQATVKQIDLCLDYLQLLLQKPTQILPILCLVSRENETGKSTFAKFLKMLFTSNVAIVGNSELSENFNSGWATKLIIVCDEAKIDKQVVVEKVKSLSTADKVNLRAMHKDHTEIDFFGKFIFLTNNEENFIYASEEDLRFWVIKVPKLKTKNPDLLDQILEEIPAFLSFMGKRKLATDRCTRMWFDPSMLKTDALKRVIAYSQPTIEKELRQHIKDLFLDFGVDQIMMSRKGIHERIFRGKYEANYLDNILKNNLKVEQYSVEEKNPDGSPKLDMYNQPIRKPVVKRFKFPWIEIKKGEHGDERKPVLIDETGRPYIFKREMFVSEHEEVIHEPDNDIQHIKDELARQDRSEIRLQTKLEMNSDQKNDDNDLPF